MTDENPPAGSYTTDMSVNGSFELPSALGASMSLTEISGWAGFSYSFSDGRGNVLDTSNSFSLGFRVATGGDGAIDAWDITLTQILPQAPGEQSVDILTGYFEATPQWAEYDGVALYECISTPCELDTDYDAGEAISNRGMWTVVPEPGTAALLVMGLAVLGHRRRRARA